MTHTYFNALLFAAILALPFGAIAQHEETHEHAGHHTQGTALVAKLQLDDGKRWPTDESLRVGMREVRAAFDADHSRIHEGKQTDAQYDALATRIETAVNRIVALCKLAPEADAQLHLIVGDLLQGVSQLRGTDPTRTRHDGAPFVHGALRAYPKYFDDPTWPPETAPHDKH